MANSAVGMNAIALGTYLNVSEGGVIDLVGGNINLTNAASVVTGVANSSVQNARNAVNDVVRDYKVSLDGAQPDMDQMFDPANKQMFTFPGVNAVFAMNDFRGMDMINRFAYERPGICGLYGANIRSAIFEQRLEVRYIPPTFLQNAAYHVNQDKVINYQAMGLATGAAAVPVRIWNGPGNVALPIPANMQIVVKSAFLGVNTLAAFAGGAIAFPELSYNGLDLTYSEEFPMDTAAGVNNMDMSQTNANTTGDINVTYYTRYNPLQLPGIVDCGNLSAFPLSYSSLVGDRKRVFVEDQIGQWQGELAAILRGILLRSIDMGVVNPNCTQAGWNYINNNNNNPLSMDFLDQITLNGITLPVAANLTPAYLQFAQRAARLIVMFRMIASAFIP